MKKLHRLSGLVVVVVIMVWVKTGYSEPSGCPACDTQYWANWSGCFFWNGHEHSFLGYWPYNGHYGYHTNTDCGDCSSRHSGCIYASLNAADAIRKGIQNGDALRPLLERHATYANLDLGRRTITIRGCDRNAVIAEIKLDGKQLSEFT